MRRTLWLALLPFALFASGCVQGRSRESAGAVAQGIVPPKGNLAGTERDRVADRMELLRWANGRMQASVAAYERGEHDAAIRGFREVVSARPMYLHGHLYLAKAYRARGSADGARAGLEAALRLDSGNREVRIELAGLHVEANRHADALALLEPIRGGIESDPRAVTVLGEALVGVGRDEEAQVWFARALDLDPASEPAFRGIVAFHALAGNRHRVEQLLRDAECAGASIATVMMGAGDDCWTRGMQGRAMQFWQDAVQRDSACTAAVARLGTGLVRLGRTAEARLTLELALAAHPADSGLRLALAEACTAEGKHETAALHLRKLLQADPDHVLARLALGRAHRACGDMTAAVVDLTRAIARNPANPQLHHELGLAYRAAGEPDLAAASFQVARKLDPDHRLVRADAGK